MSASVDGVHATLFEGCGHYPHHEHTESCASALLRFLDDPTVLPARFRATAPRTEPARTSWPSLVAVRG
jgi:hypothetical protein